MTLRDLFDPDGANRRKDRAARRTLVAAAGELLEACRKTEAAIGHSMQCDACEAFFGGAGPRCPAMAQLTHDAREARRAAITRAEGKS